MRLRVTAAAETILRGGHPWLFASSIHEQNREGTTGELAAIYDRANRFLAIGLFDPDSPLRVRLLHAGKPIALDSDWWRRRLRAALELRRPLFDAQTTGFRWIHGENDGWPGLVLDRYGDLLVLKLYTSIWLPRLDQVIELVRESLAPARLILRLSRNIQESARRRFQIEEGAALGQQPDSRAGAAALFLESGLRFEAEVTRGQKTGFFLDQRENRRRVEVLAGGRDVLNAFSFSGAFSVYAARGGAKSVTDLDISAHAVASARRNWDLNQTSIAKCRHEAVQADAFEWLEQNRSGRFGLVILDPPSMAKRESERLGAIRAYERLAGHAIRALLRGGILVAASCSAHVSNEEFFGAIRQAARKSGRPYVELETTGHPADHPATFPEANYLKCIYLQFEQSKAPGAKRRG